MRPSSVGVVEATSDPTPPVVPALWNSFGFNSSMVTEVSS